jgi:hypothetical protein
LWLIEFTSPGKFPLSGLLNFNVSIATGFIYLINYINLLPGPPDNPQKQCYNCYNEQNMNKTADSVSYISYCPRDNKDYCYDIKYISHDHTLF